MKKALGSKSNAFFMTIVISLTQISRILEFLINNKGVGKPNAFIVYVFPSSVSRHCTSYIIPSTSYFELLRSPQIKYIISGHCGGSGLRW
jgi:hypothetical protein